MRRPASKRLMHGGALGAFLMLAGCGGGGVSSTPAPPTAPAPAPSPPPAPSPSPAPGTSPSPSPSPAPTSNDTSEYRATVGAVSMNAIVGYNAGATGRGVTVGVIDSGIDLQSAEFGDCSAGIGKASCRISAASADMAGNTTIDDEAGHGTAVAFTIAGRRNGAGTLGVSFDATLVVLRADAPGTCATEDANDPDSGCAFRDSDIAQGIDAARVAGARVVNISLGGGTPAGSVIAAVNRATAAGMILVMSAGNDGTADPDPFAGTAAAQGGLVIIAGSVGTNDLISSFSNRAGTGMNNYLAAVGEDVRAPDQDNVPYLWSGTSFSAPQITGAIALLAQAFPNLTGQEIIQILYATARDAGAAGVDEIYGRGILDLTRAFQPVGAMKVAGTRGVISNGVNATLSAPMGDAQTGAIEAVALDAFDRAYQMDLTRTIGRQAPRRRLPELMASRDRSFSVGYRDMNIAVSLVPGKAGMGLERLTLGEDDAIRARALAASVTGRLGNDAQFAIGASESGTALAARLAGRADPAFLIARDPVNGSGFDVDPGSAVAVRQRVGAWGVTVAMERGDVLTRRDTTLAALQWRSERFGYTRVTLGADRRLGGVRLALNATRLSEDETLLGARFGGALGAARAQSLFVDAAARLDAGDGWTVGGSMRQGWTFARLRGGAEGSGLVRTNGFAIDIGKAGLFGGGDRFGMRVAQPLRVSGGGLRIELPTGYDYATESVDGWQTTPINLAPRGREIDYEASYAAPLWIGDVSGNVFLRSDPGNYANIGTDYGAAIRFTFGF